MGRWVIPAVTPYEIKRGQHGIAVWAVQRAYNQTGVGPQIAEDGDFGQFTVKAVKHWQEFGAKLAVVDGIFGPKTSASMVPRLAAADRILPGGLLEGLVLGESGGLIAAVNHTVQGGTDCGYTQRRVYEADYESDAVIEAAFDAGHQISLAAAEIDTNYRNFRGQAAVTSAELAWRLATLNHNYPAAAAKIAAVGVNYLPSYYTTPQPWVASIGARFPDGDPVGTPLEWCQHYSLGAPAHNEPGMMTKLVSTWA